MKEAPAQKRPYWQVFAVLAVLTAAEVGFASLDIAPGLRAVVLLVMAASKAVLVAMFYMHLRYDHRLLAIIGGFPLLLVVIMLIILMVDRVVT
ncbi:MAG: cytochrome C oxidase subunit IV family protein [Chloroflexi bacterium]|nr:cytochrome C oxidase subunit IV family protein [Chloroflexota bacterium]MCI0580691.1 cytochrome C oxidase subunit IV family protein [Chloroflexota bacterium]MCI0648578.1 cytochrome C oxidase subunit IV family protein [Chloroflexota bacterium]MCI0727341.1 cytochrome C oxidase subunit IV family protein [Chloroflexota bacterium]